MNAIIELFLLLLTVNEIFIHAGVIPARDLNLKLAGNAGTFIIGGEPVKPPFKYATWMAVIQKGDYQFCAGTMFTDKHMITAAHCSNIGFPLHTIKVSLHRHNLALAGEAEGAIEYRVVKIDVHPAFSPFTLANDIAVWHLIPIEESNMDLSSAPITANLTRVRLDNGVNSFPGRRCTVLGWGAVEEGGDASEVLQELTIPVMDQSVCKEKLGERILDSMICVGGEQGKDSCQGDSGGPLVVMRGFNLPVLVGVVSWGKGCARSGFPGVYTRISSFRDWLLAFLTEEERLAVLVAEEAENDQIGEEKLLQFDHESHSLLIQK